MISLASFPKFRSAQIEWELLTRKPDYRNETRRMKPEMIREVGRAFDAVVDSAVDWQKQTLQLTGTTVRAEKSIGPQLASMLYWVLTTYFPAAHKYPEGEFPEYDRQAGKEVQRTFEYPCWADEHEEYVHQTGGLRVLDYFLLDMTKAAKERIRALLQGNREAAQKSSFVHAFKDFFGWLDQRRTRAVELHEEMKETGREQQRLATEGWRELGLKYRAGQEARGRSRPYHGTAAELRGRAFLTRSRPEEESNES